LQTPVVVDARTGFVSDVHLSLSQPALLQYFLASLERCQGQISQLIVLGDLFDSWVGDDALALPLAQTVVNAINQLKVPVAIGLGNRDFLLGGVFANAINAVLLPDESRVVVNRAGSEIKLPSHILLAHGDQWCTADVQYQQFRKNARTPSWQRAFLAQPLEQRLGLAARLRMESETAKKDKPLAIMDVTAAAIDDAFERFDVDTIIHGHTHRPGVYTTFVGQQLRWRHVLTDWAAESAANQNEPHLRGEILTLAQLIQRRQATA
jgi:UDP-2,3-diacylglucosamine hydrolase